jgi:hypothetical protein
LPEEGTWLDVSQISKSLVLIDDSTPPYEIADITTQTGYKKYKIFAFIVPLPTHMFLSAEKAYSLTKFVFNDKNVGLKRFGNNKWITRLLLTSSRSFKKYLIQTEDQLDNRIKILLLCLAMPRFIWICEVYKEGEIENKMCSGLLVIDATGNSNTLTTILWYAITDKMIGHNGIIWDEENSDIIPFKMRTYQSNLKGEWNKWVS